MIDINLACAIGISCDGKVILSDADLVELEKMLEVPSAGGGGNGGCTNSGDCSGSANRTCTNTGNCDRSSNTTACSGTQIDS